MVRGLFLFCVISIWGDALRASDDSMLCLRAAKEASLATGVPEAVLYAVALTETGRDLGRGLQPWPWALNHGGESEWLAGKPEALVALQRALGEGRRNIDLGCFQLNWQWHASEFSSGAAMLDPRQNALYAARLLRDHFNQKGDWAAAAAAYHSQTPEHAERYLARFQPIFRAVADGAYSADSEGAAAARAGVNFYPLLMAGQAASAGSLVPITAGAGPLFGG